MEINFQLLMLSPNLLKSNFPIFRGGHGNQFPTVVAESKFAKFQSSKHQKSEIDFHESPPP